MGDIFAKGVDNWQKKLGTVRDVVRQELVSRQIVEHLGPPARSIRILDVGSGQGTQANHLADLGYTVVGVDPSSKLLDMAREAARKANNSARFVKGTLEAMPAEAGRDFDLVCCHGVLMYLPELVPAIKQLVALARPGGLISVLTRNQPGVAMRAGMFKDWKGALEGFDVHTYKNRLVADDLRADTPAEIIEAFRQCHAELIDWYGVRLFTDHWDDLPVPDDIELLVEAEYQAAQRDPYRQLAALVHVIAKRRD